MKKITQYSEVSPLVMSFFKRGVITNNFLSKDDYEAEIKEGTLFYEKGEDFLCFYIKRDGFLRLYFHAMGEDVLFPEVEGRLILEGALISHKLMEVNGFSKMMDRVMLERNGGEVKDSQGIEKAKKEDADEILRVLKKCFNEETGFLPNLTQLEKECEDGFVYKAYLQGEIKGVLRWDKKGKKARINHLAVLEDARNSGLGKNLCHSFLKDNEDAIVWTGKENLKAINLYKKAGFCQSDKGAVLYEKGCLK